jgi:hypothetical protein
MAGAAILTQQGVIGRLAPVLKWAIRASSDDFVPRRYRSTSMRASGCPHHRERRRRPDERVEEKVPVDDRGCLYRTGSRPLTPADP